MIDGMKMPALLSRKTETLPESVALPASTATPASCCAASGTATSSCWTRSTSIASPRTRWWGRRPGCRQRLDVDFRALPESGPGGPRRERHHADRRAGHRPDEGRQGRLQDPTARGRRLRRRAPAGRARTGRGRDLRSDDRSEDRSRRSPGSVLRQHDRVHPLREPLADRRGRRAGHRCGSEGSACGGGRRRPRPPRRPQESQAVHQGVLADPDRRRSRSRLVGQAATVPI